jgi:uncharacterized membrane protein
MCLVYVWFTTIDFFTAADAAINPWALQNINNNIPVSSFSPTKFIIATLVYILPLISSLWLIPYIQTTVSAFYEELKNSETK